MTVPAAGPSTPASVAAHAGTRRPEGPLRVGILGATGYVGAELVRLLERHPGVRIVGLAARNREGVPLAEAFAHLAETGHRIDAALPDPSTIDAAFLALPHGQAARLAPELLAAGVLVVDLGPDFRLRDPADYPTWYGYDHPAPGLLPEDGTGQAKRVGTPGTGTEGEAAAGDRTTQSGNPARDSGPDGNTGAVYGLPELHRAQLARARLIASPGCYPTATLLALAPLARAGLVGDVIVDAKSGVSGAGREPKLETHFGEVNESIRAYGLGGHRHVPEIRQELRLLGVAGPALDGLVFMPHLVPMTRGLLATCYVRPTRALTQTDLETLYRNAYTDEPFVQLAAGPPATKTVAGSNLARVHVRLDQRSGRVLALGAIDNLVKGAAGQAVQAFNIAVGLPEATGLEQLPLYP